MSIVYCYAQGCYFVFIILFTDDECAAYNYQFIYIITQVRRIPVGGDQTIVPDKNGPGWTVQQAVGPPLARNAIKSKY